VLSSAFTSTLHAYELEWRFGFLIFPSGIFTEERNCYIEVFRSRCSGSTTSKHGSGAVWFGRGAIACGTAFSDHGTYSRFGGTYGGYGDHSGCGGFGRGRVGSGLAAGRSFPTEVTSTTARRRRR
jgi:hypothetical protein